MNPLRQLTFIRGFPCHFNEAMKQHFPRDVIFSTILFSNKMYNLTIFKPAVFVLAGVKKNIININVIIIVKIKSNELGDSITVTRDLNEVVEQATTNIDKARLLAVHSSHSNDWLHALPISLCGLRLDN